MHGFVSVKTWSFIACDNEFCAIIIILFNGLAYLHSFQYNSEIPETNLHQLKEFQRSNAECGAGAVCEVFLSIIMNIFYLTHIFTLALVCDV